MVFPVVGFLAVDEHAVEVEVAVEEIAGAISFLKDLGAAAVPVEVVGLSGCVGGGFADSFAVAVIKTGHAVGGDEMIFGVEDIGTADGAGLDQVSGGIVDVVVVGVLKLVFGSGAHAPVFLRAARIRGRNRADAGEIAPGVVVELLAPALGGRAIALPPGLILVKRFCGGKAVEGIVAEELGAFHIEVVGYGDRVAIVVAAGCE